MELNSLIHHMAYTCYVLTYHFLFGAENTQLAKAHMKWWALVGAISLADDHDINAAG